MAITKGYVKTMFGLKVRLPYATQYSSVEEFVERNKHMANIAINAPIQGTAGQITLKSAVELRKALRKEPVGRSVLVNTVHDSLDGYAKKNKIIRIGKIFKSTMEGVSLPFKFNCPIVADIASGSSWGGKTELKI